MTGVGKMSEHAGDEIFFKTHVGEVRNGEKCRNMLGMGKNVGTCRGKIGDGQGRGVEKSGDQNIRS